MERDSVRHFAEERDEESFRLLVEEYRERVFRLVSSILGPWSDLDAEEVTQEIFLLVYRKAGQFRGDSAGASWLYRVAYTRAQSFRRRARVRLPHEGDETLAALAAATVDPLEAIASTRRKVELLRALEELPDLYRTVLHSYYWQEMSVAEIADALVVPEGTVKSYLSRARARLRVLLERCCQGGAS